MRIWLISVALVASLAGCATPQYYGSLTFPGQAQASTNSQISANTTVVETSAGYSFATPIEGARFNEQDQKTFSDQLVKELVRLNIFSGRSTSASPYHLDLKFLRSHLEPYPRVDYQVDVLVTLTTPNGTPFSKTYTVSSKTLHPGVANNYPEAKLWLAQGLLDQAIRDLDAHLKSQ